MVPAKTFLIPEKILISQVQNGVFLCDDNSHAFKMRLYVFDYILP